MRSSRRRTRVGSSVGRSAVAVLGGLAVVAVACSGGQEDGAVPPDQMQVAQLVGNLTDTTSTVGSVDGLTGMAFTNDGKQLLIIRNSPDGSLELAALPYADGERLDGAAARPIMKLPHPFVHNGGGIAMTSTGDAYVSVVAEVPSGGDPASVRRPDGVIVKVPAASISGTADGLFVPAADDVVARGFRNPWRIALDPETGDLWVGDNGEDLVEEIDRIPAADLATRTLDFGWPFMEGTQENLTLPKDGSAQSFIAPYHEYEHTDGHCSITGGFVYRGKVLADLDGSYLFGEFCGSDLSAISVDGSPTSAEVGDNRSNTTAIVGDPAGNVYTLSGDGAISRLDAASDSTRTLPKVVSVPIATMWGSSGSPGAGRELSSMVVTPGGESLLVAERGGIIAEVLVGDVPDERRGAPGPMQDLQPGTTLAPKAALCAVDPNLRITHLSPESPDDLRRDVETSRATLAALAPLLDDRLAASVARLGAAFDAIVAEATKQSWDTKIPALRDLLRTIEAERGQFAEAYYDQQLILHELSGCQR